MPLGASLGTVPTAPAIGAPPLGGGVSRAPRKKLARPGQVPGGPSTTYDAPPSPTPGAPPAAPAQAPTFAQMQQEGRARPAPPPVAPPPTLPSSGAVPGYEGSAQAGAVRNDLQGAVQRALQNPSRYDTDTFNTVRDSAYADLDNEFARERQATDENLARRGLSASTFGANEIHDVAGAQSRAKANLTAQLLREAANTQAADRTSAYGMGSDLASMAGSQDLQTYGANANATSQSFQNQLAAALGLGNLGLQEKGLAQSGSQFDRSLDQSGQQFNLQQALAEKLGMGNLGLQERSLSQQKDLTESGRTFEAGQAALNRGESSRQFDLQQKLAEVLGLGNLGLQKDSLAQNKDLTLSGRNFEADQAALARGESGRQFDLSQALSEKLGLGNLALQKEGLAQNKDLTLSGRAFQSGESALDRSQQGSQFSLQQALAEKLGMGNLDVAKQNASSNAQLANSDLLLRVMGAMGGLTPELMKQLMTKLGMMPPPAGGTQGNPGEGPGPSTTDIDRM